MHRLGRRPGNKTALKQIFEMENLHIQGTYSHLSASDGQETGKYPPDEAANFLF